MWFWEDGYVTECKYYVMIKDFFCLKEFKINNKLSCAMYLLRKRNYTTPWPLYLIKYYYHYHHFHWVISMNKILLTEILIFKAIKFHQGVKHLQQPNFFVAITSTLFLLLYQYRSRVPEVSFTHISLVLHFILKQIIWFAVQIKWLVPM